MDFHGSEYESRIFSWIISADISVPLKIYGYEYEYAKFSWILSMGVPNLSLDCSWQSFSRYIPNQTLVSMRAGRSDIYVSSYTLSQASQISMKLFGSLIGWRANKQATVTTSTTEAELLALEYRRAAGGQRRTVY